MDKRKPLSALARKRALMLAMFSMLAACASAPPYAGQNATAPDPVAFFAPGTVGQGVLTYTNGQVDRAFEVRSAVQELDDGQIAIDQKITFADGAAEARRWVMSRMPDAEGVYTGTLTDASGAVTAEQRGGALRVRYPIADVPFGRMEQFLYLQPDGKTVVNVGTVRVLGLPVRHMSEVIVQNAEEPAASEKPQEAP